MLVNLCRGSPRHRLAGVLRNLDAHFLILPLDNLLGHSAADVLNLLSRDLPTLWFQRSLWWSVAVKQGRLRGTVTVNIDFVVVLALAHFFKNVDQFIFADIFVHSLDMFL